MATSIDPKTMTIRHTQGDTFEHPLRIFVKHNDGTQEPYVPSTGDEIRIAIKASYNAGEPILRKVIPNDTLIIRFEAEETKLLKARGMPYVYDIELKTPAGNVITFIDRKQWYSTEEVD